MQAFLKGTSISTKPPLTKDRGVAAIAGSSGENKKAKPVPWVEKYRPKCVDEVAFQEEVVAVLKKSLEGADLPNLLFYGPPGTGKTSTILAAARELFGSFFLWISQALPLKWLGQLLALKHPEYKQSVWWLLQYDSRPELFRLRVLELNASDERGIQVVREKVKNFAQLTVSGSRSDGKPCPPFKIVILDEADSMTSAAQAALRRTMEKESKTTRFCLICNYVSRIIEPLTSRCSKFRFKPLSDKIQQQRLLDIAGKEHVKISNEGVSYLVKVSEGDLRKAITFLQSATRLTGGKEITEKVITDIAGVIPAETIDGIFAACQSGSFDKLEAVVKDLIDEGHAATQLVNQLHDVIVENDNLSDKQKSIITEKLAEVDKCLADGADEHLQLISLCATVMQQLTQNC
ncbi:replication factor C subunit 4 isoform X1 [Pteropus medius]|uniref:replication factor C subunit 4 isoform X1 n=1 Tax=Pteropus vampyrus TaxID=132908 RepID=UPI00196B9045|nr:replication factor C subunit 4 isoform X1 [Pteropus giganteus]XP_039706807.1 replication factor C subunit 4 isoform X1 [Pteropus giganteus]XP_039706808.1 replication factor C subunit 4 isoform X1 [Pteropus giganteus]XP_039706809.1 replication factor C subunit 4 isoform X1 [Pteropus giganteus]